MKPKAKPVRPAIIDIEASGFGNGSYPIEIGVILSSGLSYCALIYPDADWQHWDQQAEALHGISRKTLLAKGKAIALIAAELNELLADQTVYCDGWVVDKPWLTQLFQKSGAKPKFSLSALEMILKEPQMEIWATTKAQVIQDLALTRHRASADARIIQETYARTQQLTKTPHETASPTY
jgi:hypothetical protein